MKRSLFLILLFTTVTVFIGAQELSGRLVQAVSAGDRAEIKSLLLQGADINGIDSVGMTPLVMAVIRNHTEIVELLLQNGADPRLSTISGISPIETARSQKRVRIDMLLTDQLLKQSGKGYTYLTTAVLKKDKETITKLIELEYDINSRDTEGATSLMYAIYHGYTEIAKLLVSAGADINAADKAGMQALHIAAASGSLKGVLFLLQNGVRINDQTAKGETALLLAAKYRHINIMELLIKNGADLSIRNKEGKSFLDYDTDRP